MSEEDTGKEDEDEHSLRPFNEFEDMCFGKVNDKMLKDAEIALLRSYINNPYTYPSQRRMFEDALAKLIAG